MTNFSVWDLGLYREYILCVYKDAAHGNVHKWYKT